GCYLGQETVARIDALGHVNRRLVAISVDGSLTVGAALRSGGEPVGTITSACHSPRVGADLGLAIALAKRLGAEAILEVDGRPARGVSVPVVGCQVEGGHG
ncbi:MAG: glycine cleavage T C-terminal barrel domain-containing protein, partial [Planctomycetota bacterium]